MMLGLAGTVAAYSICVDCLELGTVFWLAVHGLNFDAMWVKCKFSYWFYLCGYACLFGMKGLLQNGGNVVNMGSATRGD